jgi:cell division protein FtsB|tara:strand:+ start:624 stop:959 length:336 start_codon:yes stop_codon:yes gene_type:complete
MVASNKTAVSESSNAGDTILKLVIGLLMVMLLVLQYRLWVGEGSLAETHSLSLKVAEQKEKNRLMQQGSEQLAAEVKALKTGLDEVEARAREELGMVKPGETFYLVVDETP